MAQQLDHATYQIYETYHAPVNVLRDRRTYDHFASGYSRTLRQAELLPDYMEQMIKGLLKDLDNQGDCWLLRAIINHELPAIHLLDHSAILYVYARLFDPDELPRLDTRSVPFSGDFSSTPGGMLYTDRRARSTTLDLRQNELLHPICHALLMYAAYKAGNDAVADLQKENMNLRSRITQLNDQKLGLERQLASREQSSGSSWFFPDPNKQPRLITRPKNDT